MLHIMLAYDLHRATELQRKKFNGGLEQLGFVKLKSADTTWCHTLPDAKDIPQVSLQMSASIRAAALISNIASLDYDMQVGNSPVVAGIYRDNGAVHVLDASSVVDAIKHLLDTITK